MITAVFSTMGHDTSCVDNDHYLSEIRSEINKTYIFLIAFLELIFSFYYYFISLKITINPGKLGNRVPEIPLVYKELTWPIVLKTAVSSRGTMDI